MTELGIWHTKNDRDMKQKDFEKFGGPNILDNNLLLYYNKLVPAKKKSIKKIKN